MYFTPALLLSLAIAGCNALPALPSLVGRQTAFTGTCNVTSQIFTVTEPADAAGIELDCGRGGVDGYEGTDCLVDGYVSHCLAMLRDLNCW